MGTDQRKQRKQPSRKSKEPKPRVARKQPPRTEVIVLPGAEEESAAESQLAASVAMEGILRVVRPMLAERDFSSPEEMEAFLESISEDDFLRARAALIAGSPREEAQQLAYQAMLEVEEDEEAVELARRAFQLDPECVDALVLLAELTCDDRVGEFIERLEHAVETGRRVLGEAFFKAHPDDVWEALEARPYARGFAWPMRCAFPAAPPRPSSTSRDYST